MRSQIVETDKIRNVYQPEDKSIIRHGGGVIIAGSRENKEEFSIHVSNPILGMSAFLILDRAELVAIRDALNKEFAS